MSYDPRCDFEDITGYYRFPSFQLAESYPLRNLKGLPEAIGVYIVFDPSLARPLYVGKSKNFSKRIKSNANHPTLLNIYLQHTEARVALMRWNWNLQINEFISKEVHDVVKEIGLTDFEGAAIQFYNPVLNKRRPKINLLGLWEEDDPRFDAPIRSHKLRRLLK